MCVVERKRNSKAGDKFGEAKTAGLHVKRLVLLLPSAFGSDSRPRIKMDAFSNVNG